MRELIRLLIAAVFYYSGIVGLVLQVMQRSRRRLIILNYHQAEGEMLPRQMRYLRDHFRVLHLDEALEEFYAPLQDGKGKQRGGDKRLPLVLTFDDGYLDNYLTGLQLASSLRVPITIFLIPGYVESGRCFWWLVPDYLLSHTEMKTVKLDERVYNLAHPVDRAELRRDIDRRLRYAPSVAQREAFLDELQHVFEVKLPCRSHGSTETVLPLNWEEMRLMEQSGWVSFGAHTQHHPILGYLDDPAEVIDEVKRSRLVLEEALGHPVHSFAYPVGKLEHVGSHGVMAVKEAGFKWALTTIEEANTPQTDPLLLRRLPGDLTQHWLIMACELVGLLGVVSRIRKKL